MTSENAKLHWACTVACNTELEALKQNTSEPANAAVDREAWVINITLIKADVLHLKHHPSHSQQESARKRKSPEDTAQPFYRQDMVSSDSSTSIRSLLHPTDTGAVLIQPDNILLRAAILHKIHDAPSWPNSAAYWCSKIKMDGTDDSTVTYYGANVKNGKGKRSCMIT